MSSAVVSCEYGPFSSGSTCNEAPKTAYEIIQKSQIINSRKEIRTYLCFLWLITKDTNGLDILFPLIY